MFCSPKLSLTDLLGTEYVSHVAQAGEALGFLTREEALAVADEKVDFYPDAMQKKNDELLASVGKELTRPFQKENKGAPTDAFRKAAHSFAAPLTGACGYRLGENGRLYLLGKSEHYQASLGHRFPGYMLIDNARKLGILNATHNNTRGFVTRLLERRLIAAANGLGEGNEEALDAILRSAEPHVLNRVINLETGSLACEAAIKMMLARFYRLEPTSAEPKYAGKTPVFFVMQDQHGGPEANYHGTCITAQTFRGLWPELAEKLEAAEIYKVVPVAVNDLEDFRAKLERYNTGNCKTAGFLHELILMNYGGVRLEPEYVRAAHALCRQTDTPTMVDEIQTGMWYPGMFLFRLYGLQPDFVTVGKGFPGGEYPASKIITTAEMDTLSQFGALVTNGQEELASLAYLVTMTFEEANKKRLHELGERFEHALHKIADDYSKTVCRAEGLGLLGSLHFHDVATAARFASLINEECIDTSAQLYKANCPPAVLLKPPVIASEKMLDFLAERLRSALNHLEHQN